LNSYAKNHQGIHIFLDKLMKYSSNTSVYLIIRCIKSLKCVYVCFVCVLTR